MKILDGVHIFGILIILIIAIEWHCVESTFANFHREPFMMISITEITMVVTIKIMIIVRRRLEPT